MSVFSFSPEAFQCCAELLAAPSGCSIHRGQKKCVLEKTLWVSATAFHFLSPQPAFPCSFKWVDLPCESLLGSHLLNGVISGYSIKFGRSLSLYSFSSTLFVAVYYNLKYVHFGYFLSDSSYLNLKIK